MMRYEAVIGLEVHVQLKTESKIFCSCSTDFDSRENSNICPVCCGYPGVLPVLNRKALELAVRVGLALNCKINPSIYFERKSYFYPDLPKNYQISQYKMPLGENGFISLGSAKKVRINRVHMEEDAGKLIHRDDRSLVDLNRAGIPLLEIVSEPDISTPDEAHEYLRRLKLLLQYIGASDCDMEKGTLRCDANISLRPEGQAQLGVKVEIKNMNSFKGVRLAIESEINRQDSILKQGGKIYQETRLFDSLSLSTAVMRTKEYAHDYRYFPEPDLPDFSVGDDLIQKQKGFIGESPFVKKERFINDLKLCEADADTLVSNAWLADYFEKVISFCSNIKQAANWILGPFLELINTIEGGAKSVKIPPQEFAKIVSYFSEGLLNNITAKKALALSITTGENVDDIIKKEKLEQICGSDELGAVVEKVVAGNEKAVSEYRQGKDQALQFLVGQVMKETKGKANPKLACRLLEEAVKGGL